VKTGAASARGWLNQPCSVLLFLLFLAACDGSTAPQPSASATPLPSAAPTSPARLTPTPTADIGPVDLKTAWGAAPIHRLPSDMGQQQVFVFENAATPDGHWLVGALEPRNFLHNTTRLSSLVLYNITSRQVQTLRPLLTPQSQIITVSVDEHWIVWSEAPDQPNFFDWTLFAYNRQSRQVKRLAQAVKVNGQAVPGPAPMPSVAHGMVLWGQPLGPVSPTTLENAVVKLENLATDSVTTLATRAGNPTGMSWPWVMWGQVTTGANGYIVLRNLSTRQEVQIQSQPGSVSIAGASMAYTDLKTIYLLDDFTQSTTNYHVILSVSEPDHLQFITLNNRLIAWTQDTTTQVWDRTEHRLVTLPISNGKSDSWVGGHTLVWLDPESKAQQDQDTRDNLIPTPTFNVMDTNTLPILP
jgi:hypothetical protein